MLLDCKKKYLIFIIFLFYGCGGNDSVLTNVETSQCEVIAPDFNATFLDSELSPIEKDFNYILIKDKFEIEPLSDGTINVEITNIDVDGDSIFDCVKVKQDMNDIVDAQIRLK